MAGSDASPLMREAEVDLQGTAEGRAFGYTGRRRPGQPGAPSFGGIADDLDAPTASAASAAGGPRRRLVVLDFDRTISREHMWNTYRDAPLDKVPVSDATFVDLVALRDFFSLVRDTGHVVALATFGRQDVADKALRYAIGEHHGTVISTPGGPSGEQLARRSTRSRSTSVVESSPSVRPGGGLPRNKNLQLQLLAQRFQVGMPQIIFLDDDAHNVREAVKVGIDARHTPEGLTLSVLQRVAHALGEHVGSLKAETAPSEAKLEAMAVVARHRLQADLAQCIADAEALISSPQQRVEMTPRSTAGVAMSRQRGLATPRSARAPTMPDVVKSRPGSSASGKAVPLDAGHKVSRSLSRLGSGRACTPTFGGTGLGA